jgi:hypothetical protein
MDKHVRESLTKKMKEAAKKEVQAHQGLEQILDPKVGNAATPSLASQPGSS